MLDIPLLGIRREKQDGSGFRSNLNRRSNFEDFWVGHPEKSLLKMSDSLAGFFSFEGLLRLILSSA